MASIAFDIYGTLIDTQGINTQLATWLGDEAETFSNAWRQKQLEYSFRRGLMQSSVPFSQCTREALAWANACHGRPLDESQQTDLLERYRILPAYAEVDAALAMLCSAHGLYAFSNGELAAIEKLMEHAGLSHHFNGMVSVEAVGVFKPAPAVYQHMAQAAGVALDALWLVSSNPFDVMGAKHAGARAIWVNRGGLSVLDPWEWRPDYEVGSLADITGLALDV